MQTFRTALKESGWVFLISRIAIVLVSYIGIVLLPQKGAALPVACTGGIRGNPCTLLWLHWDAAAYVRVAHQGYAFAPDVAFFPLWPLVMHYVGLALGGRFPFSYYLAGLLLSNICFFFTLVLLYILLAEDFEPSLARRVLFYFSFYPFALFFFLGFSEALFLLLCVAVFLCLRRSGALDWWYAGGLGFLAVLTRSSGVLLCLPFLLVYVRHFWLPAEGKRYSVWQKLNGLAPVVLIPAALVVYEVYLYYTKGNPFLFQAVEAHYWGRQFTPLWSTFIVPVERILQNPLFSLTTVQNIVDLIFVVLPIAALIAGWKLLPLHYSLFAAAIMLFALSFTLSPLYVHNTLGSQPRYMMSAFPIFVIFALWGKRSRFDQVYVGISIAMLAVNALLFVTHHWVA
jgi:Mannosyltransferase (PIG-V)